MHKENGSERERERERESERKRERPIYVPEKGQYLAVCTVCLQISSMATSGLVVASEQFAMFECA